jgi:protein-disulfide isomerase
LNVLRPKVFCAAVFLVLLVTPPGMSQPSIDIGNSPSLKGNKDAKAVLLEFADYQCPFCARFYRETFPRIEKNYILTGKIKFIYRNFPLERSHPYALKAAEAAICSGEQGKFWAMHTRLFDLQDTRYFNDWERHAQALALDAVKFARCLEDEATALKIKTDLADGKRAGVKVTPTFLFGVADSKTSRATIFDKIEGAQDYSNFKAVLDHLIDIVK